MNANCTIVRSVRLYYSHGTASRSAVFRGLRATHFKAGGVMRLVALAAFALLNGCAVFTPATRQQPVDMALMQAVGEEVGAYVASVLPAASTAVLVGVTDPDALSAPVATALRSRGFALATSQQERLHAYSVTAFASVLAEGVVLQISIDGERASRFYQRDPDGAIWSGSPFTVASRGIRERAMTEAVFAQRAAPVEPPPVPVAVAERKAPMTATARVEPMKVHVREASGGTSPAVSLPASRAPLVPGPIEETPAPPAESVASAPVPVDVVRKSEAVLGPTPALPVVTGLRATPSKLETTAASAAPPAVVVPARTYQLTAGETVRAALLRWCTDEGWTLVWKSDYDYPIEAKTTFPAGTGFKDAVRQVLSSYRGQEHALEGRAYSNQVLEILGRKEP